MVHLGAIAAKNIQVAAALQLLTDRGAPPSVISELIFTWLDGLANFLQQAQAQGQIRSDVDPVEAAEFMLTANIGTTLVPSRSKSAQNRRRRLNFIRLGMFSIGATNANTVVDEVLLSGYIDVPAINPPAPDDKV